MRYSVNIMFGNSLAQTVQELKKYIMKYGEKPLSPYFNAIHWQQAANGDVLLSQVKLKAIDADEFIPSLNNEYTVELQTEIFPANKKEHALSDYFDNLCASTITADNVGDYRELHFCLYIPLYDEELWQQAKTLIETINALNNRLTQIDLIGFDADLSNVISSDNEDNVKKQRKKQAKETIKEIVAYSKENHGNISHFLIMQNTQTGGISLNLNADSFVRVLGEFSMLCIENYKDVFGIVPPESELQAFGLSVLHFDRYYFIEYLLHKAYLFAMEREGIHQEEVDINMAFNKSKDILKNRVNLFSEFIKKEVFPLLDQKMEENQIVEKVAPLLKAELNKLEAECNDFINDKTLSIPAKRAILTALLGYDDELFVNTIFDDNAPILYDLDSDAMQVFIQANNELLRYAEQNEKGEEEHPFESAALLSKNGEEVEYPLADMKKLHTEMQRRMGYIRDLESQQGKLESQIGNIEETKKCLVEGEYYVFGEQKFRLLPKIDEVPLAETYTAHEAKAVSVDLRENFPKIKSQGQQGSCTAHALTSIYEYILKSNKAEKADLSEAFLYYNARKKVSKENSDEGSSYESAIESLVEFGICEEALMPYSDSDFSTPPSVEAYDNALSRRVKKAFNVKREIGDLKSALEDGYPVAISAVLYDSFGTGMRGIIALPTENEKQREEHGRHAMVICGYNDENKLFLVRNSWGTSFGDNGYCYMPYSYITNPDLCPFAAAIIEIATAEKYMVTIKKTKSTLNFDETDTTIRFAITKNLIAEEKLLLEQNQKQYELLQLHLEWLRQTLKNPNLQANLRNSTKERLTKEINKLTQEREKANTAKQEALDEHDKHTYKTGIKWGLIALSALVFVGIIAYFVDWYIFSRKYIWYTFGAVAVIVLTMVYLYFPYRKKKRRELELNWNDELQQMAVKKAEKEKELTQTKVKMHIAGHYLSKLFELQAAIVAKYYSTSSFLSNLKTWYLEENQTLGTLDADTQLPFIPLLKNSKLDEYFEKHKKEITDKISLCSSIVNFSKNIENETIKKEDIVAFKAQIKKNCVKELEGLIQNFNIYSFLCNLTVKYEYLDETKEFVAEILPKLDEKSNIFLCDNGTEIIVPSKFILINAPTDDDTRNWERFYPKYFTQRPNSLSFLSFNKVMVVQLTELNVNQIN